MSIRIMSKVFEQSKTKGAARLVLLALSDNASDEGECYPSIATVARKAAVSEITTREYLHAFEKIGLITIKGRVVKGAQSSNTYKINADKIGSDDIPAEVLIECRAPSKRVRPPITGLYRGGVSGLEAPPITGLEANHQLTINEPSFVGAENRTDAPAPEKVKRTRSAKQIARDNEVKAICEAFSQESGMPLPPHLFTKPNKTEIALFLIPAGRIIDKCNGRSVEAVKIGTRQHLKAGLSVKGVCSIEYTTNAPPPARVESLSGKDYT